MKEISHNECMDMIKKLNEGQPSVTDLIDQQIESYENEINSLNKNTWGIGFYELNEKDEFNKLLGLNLGTEQKAREVFDRIQNEFKKNTVNPDAIIDLVDEDYNVIEHYPLTKKQIVTVASLLGHEIKLGVTEMENPRSREGRIKFILKKLGADNAPLKYLATLNDRQLKAYFDMSYPDLKDKEDYIAPRYSPRGHSLENEFVQLMKRLDESDIEEAQNRDFDHMTYALKDFTQTLYDLLGSIDESEGTGLTKKEIRKRKAVLDMAFTYLYASADDIRKYLESEYEEELNTPQFKHLKQL
ncbi:hypothetical protein [Bacillus subtilis]|uniref:hypothetical protein n=1 Tax=Bacillus subtilis TaxID=1423 RepID=UPI002DBC018C|nr:hypothetical protein [Bacillus subtilis]MEC3665005.1 hypothetical protein [Bacillus subtilis]